MPTRNGRSRGRGIPASKRYYDDVAKSKKRDNKYEIGVPNMI